MPASIPVTMQILIASVKMLNEIKMGKPMAEEMNLVRMNTSNSPIIPPSIHRKADSSKNSVMILERLAPIAFFNPICAVRSLTVTNIILATPNMPTMSDRAAMAHPPKLIEPKMVSRKLLAEEISLSAKLSGWVGLSFLTER